MNGLDGRRVIVVMMSALGDAVHVLPLITALRRQHPSCHISWLLERGAASLMRGHPDVDEIVQHGRGIGALAALRRTMRGRRYDLLIDLQVALKAGLATALIPATVKLGFDRARSRDLNWLFTNSRIPPHAPQHVQDQYLEFARHLSVDPEPLRWNLGPWPGEEPFGESLRLESDRPLVTLALASSRVEKDWVPERWIQLARALYEKHGLQPVLAGGSSAKERELEKLVLTEAGVPVLTTLGCTLRQLVSIIAASRLVVSPDTAPLHISVAVGTPVIALMGFTNPNRVGPYRRFADLLVDSWSDPGEEPSAALEYRSGRMERIQVGDVLERVQHWERRYRDPANPAGTTA